MAGKKTEAKKAGSISKSALVNAVVEAAGDVTRKQVKAVLDALSDIAYKELRKAGIFTLPGFAKFRVVKKPATKARQGINPFTKAADDVPAEAGEQVGPRASHQGDQGLDGLRRPAARAQGLGVRRRGCPSVRRTHRGAPSLLLSSVLLRRISPSNALVLA
jgi:DNA-binding protein HU-beta